MALKPKITKDEHAALEPALQGVYKPARDGQMELDVEGGFVAKSQHDEVATKLSTFRDNNIALTNERTTLSAENQSLKTAKSELETKLAGFESRGITSPDAAPAKIQEAVTAALAPFKTQVDTLTQQNAEKDRRLIEQALDGRLRDVAQKKGVRPEAISDFVRDAKEAGWRLTQNGDGLAALKSDGSPVYSPEHPDRALTFDEHVITHREAKPHQYGPSGGAGGTQTDGRPGDTRSGARIVAETDFAANLEDIAKGKATTVQTH